jgi:hypothetical protein
MGGGGGAGPRFRNIITLHSLEVAHAGGEQEGLNCGLCCSGQGLIGFVATRRLAIGNKQLLESQRVTFDEDLVDGLLTTCGEEGNSPAPETFTRTTSIASPTAH